MKCVGINGVKRASKGFVAIVTAPPGKLLLGGVREIKSSSFCSQHLAKQWARAMRDNNPKGTAIEYKTVYSKKKGR